MKDRLEQQFGGVIMKQFTKKQSEWIQFAILMADAAVIYGIRLVFRAGHIDRWAALALTIVVTGLGVWCTRKHFWKHRIRQASESEGGRGL